MTNPPQKHKKKNPRRALLKSLLVLGTTVATIAILAHLITDQQLDQLKHHLNLGTIILLLVIINLVSFACFLVLYMAYSWIRQDLKPPRDGDFSAAIDEQDK